MSSGTKPSGTFLKDLNVNQATLKNDLEALGSTELALLTSLQTVAKSGAPATSAEITSIEEELKSVAAARAAIYELLGSALKSDYSSLVATSPLLSSQSDTLNFIEGEILTNEDKLKAVRQENINKVRLIEINEYYASLYEDQAWLMKIIVIMCVHISVLCILYKVLKFPENIFYMCLGGTLVVGSYFFITKAVNIASRDNMNYDAYNIPFNPPNTVVPANATVQNPWYAENNVSSVDCSSNN